MSKRQIETGVKKRRRIFLGVGIFLVLLILFLLVMGGEKDEKRVPTLCVETPQKVSLQQGEFSVDVTISSFGDAIYPAASASIDFDPAYLEFLGVEEGNVFIRSDGDGVPKNLPDWSCSPEVCNQTGKINVMYLDVTGGKNAFSKELLTEGENVVFRLSFRLRGSAGSGDVYHLIVDDAVFAASDETQSLAMTTGTLVVRNGKIVIGE